MYEHRINVIVAGTHRRKAGKHSFIHTHTRQFYTLTFHLTDLCTKFSVVVIVSRITKPKIRK